jgi:hypothetical protein
MLRSGFGVLAGLLWLVSCSSTTSHPNQGSAGTTSTGAGAGANAANGASGNGATLPEVDASTAIGFCEGYYAIVAKLLAKCWGIPEANAQGLLPDAQLCQAFATSVDEGRISFDPGPAAACLNELGKAASCDGPTDPQLIGDCTVLKPLVPTGETCTLFSSLAVGQECMGDAYCQEPEAYACSGVCAEPPALGAPCDLLKGDVRCGPDATCDSTSKTCVAKPADVELDGACGGDGLGNCKDPLWCEVPASGAPTGVCHAKKTSGSCSLPAACALPAVCAGPEGSRSCVAPKNEGESCTPGLRECNIASHCGANKKCTSQPVTLGEACGSVDGESVPCGRDAYCEGTPAGAGTCQKRKQPGDACTGKGYGECDGNRGHCDSGTQRCVACP